MQSSIGRTTNRLRASLISGKKELKTNWQLYVTLLLPMVFVFVFSYIPMYGALIAFKNYRAVDGIWGSEWVGFKYFIDFFTSYQFKNVMRNTVVLSLYSLIAGFPFPIILALALNNCRFRRFKRTVQMFSYAPYFISTVVMVGMLNQMLSMQTGIVNIMLQKIGIEPIMFMGRPELFSSVYVWSNVWQGSGWNAIIYLAALSTVDPELHDAAIVDGASRFKRMLCIDLPCIMPTIVMLLILNIGSILNVSYEKVLLMQSPMNIERSEIISTYVYKVGMASNLPNYSYATAIGLFNSVISYILITIGNKVSGKIGGTKLW